MTRQATRSEVSASVFLRQQRRALELRLVQHERSLAELASLGPHGAGRPARADEDGNAHAERFVVDLDRQLLEQRTRVVLREIRAAIARLDDGSYGRCDSCAQPIEARRLAALPEATRCGRCPTTSRPLNWWQERCESTP